MPGVWPGRWRHVPYLWYQSPLWRQRRVLSRAFGLTGNHGLFRDPADPPLVANIVRPQKGALSIPPPRHNKHANTEGIAAEN